MRVAVTFCNKTEQKRGKNKHDNLFLPRSEPESLPHLIKFEVPLQFPGLLLLS